MHLYTQRPVPFFWLTAINTDPFSKTPVFSLAIPEARKEEKPGTPRRQGQRNNLQNVKTADNKKQITKNPSQLFPPTINHHQQTNNFLCYYIFMGKIDWKKLVGAIILCQMAGVIGSFFTAPAIRNWYTFLVKPAINPPSWLFAPVWSTLYTLMGISLYIVWQKGLGKKKVRDAILWFLIQLVFNAFWSVVFFGLRNIFAAFITIVALWILIIIVVLKFYRLDRGAGYLLLPYLLWVSFAAYLNFSLWLLNP